MQTVDVKPELIRWAIDRSGLPTEDLAAKFPKLEGWKTGEKRPTFRQLEEFAKKTMTPFGFLFLQEPPREEFSILDFRTVGDRAIGRPSPDLIDTVHTMQRRQDWMRDLLIEEGCERVDFVGSGKNLRDVEQLAQRIRGSLGLNADWAAQQKSWEDAVVTLRDAIERIGILVFSNSVVGLNNHRPLDPEEFRGFVLCDFFAPLVFVNAADSKSAQMFTLAHELVHVCIGADGLFNLVRTMPADDLNERLCNRVAAEILVPGEMLVERWAQASETPEPFRTLSLWFKVSPLVAARRALDLRLIDKPAFFRFYEHDREAWQRQKSKQRRKQGGGNFYATQDSRLGRRFAEAVVGATRGGRLMFRDAYQLTGLKGDAFRRYSDRVLERAEDGRL